VIPDDQKDYAPFVTAIVTSYNNEYVFFGDSKGIILQFMPSHKDDDITVVPVHSIDCTDKNFQPTSKNTITNKNDVIQINDDAEDYKVEIECMCICKHDKHLVVGFNKKLL